MTKASGGGGSDGGKDVNGWLTSSPPPLPPLPLFLDRSQSHEKRKLLIWACSNLTSAMKSQSSKTLSLASCIFRPIQINLIWWNFFKFIWLIDSLSFIDLKPRDASSLLPGLPAYIIFMCIRHADYINSDIKIKTFLAGAIGSIRKLIKQRIQDFDSSIFWLVNTSQLLQNLKQYSGDKVSHTITMRMSSINQWLYWHCPEQAYQEGNSRKQNEQCLRNFDLSQYRQVVTDMSVWIYQVGWFSPFPSLFFSFVAEWTLLLVWLQAIVKIMEEKVDKLIVKAVLEQNSDKNSLVECIQLGAVRLQLWISWKQWNWLSAEDILQDVASFRNGSHTSSSNLPPGNPLLFHISAECSVIWIVLVVVCFLLVVLLHLCDLDEPITVAQRFVPLDERYPDPVQCVTAGALGPQSAHQRTRVGYFGHRFAAANHRSRTTAPSQQDR